MTNSAGIHLRPYQEDGVRRIREAFAAGTHAPLYVLPTGGGKTILFAHVSHAAASKNNRVLILSHRIELVDQISAALAATATAHGFIAAGYPRAIRQCMIASVPTLLRRLDSVPEPQLIIIDECVDGSATITTELGDMALEDAQFLHPRYVLSYDGAPCFKAITRFWNKGTRKCLTLHTKNGNVLRCTADHLIFTPNGWRHAKEIVAGDRVLAVAGNSPSHAMAPQENGLMDTESGEGNASISKQDLQPQSKPRHFAPAVADREFLRSQLIRKIGVDAGSRLRPIRDMSWATISGLMVGMSSWTMKSVRPFSALCLEIVRSAFQTNDRQTVGSRGHTGKNKRGGSGIRQDFCGAFASRLGKLRIKATETLVGVARRAVCHVCLTFIASLEAMGQSASRSSGLNNSLLSVSLGGIATTDHAALGLGASLPMQFSTQRGTRRRKTWLSGIGLRRDMDTLLSQETGGGITSCDSVAVQQRPCLAKSTHTCRENSATSWDTVTEIREDGARDVYDIEVSGTHSFFANGILVHNCHHSRSATWESILTRWPRAKLLGVTATPVRTSGEGLGKIFDHLIVGPSVAELTTAGYLAPARVFAPPTVDTSGLHTRAGDFVAAESEELLDKPAIIGSAVGHYERLARGLPALVFCVSVKHAQNVAEQFRMAGHSAMSLDGATAREVRRGVVADFRRGSIKILASCDLFSEGFDVPGVHVGIMLRPTQSLGLFSQQVGRILRPTEGKTHALILDHCGNTRRFGLPDEPRNWTLEGEERKRKTPSNAIRICPACFCALPPRMMRCDQCGHAFESAPRTVPELEGELAEITPEELARRRARREQGRAQSLEALIEIGRRKGYRSPERWAAYVWKGRQAKRSDRRSGA